MTSLDFTSIPHATEELISPIRRLYTTPHHPIVTIEPVSQESQTSDVSTEPSDLTQQTPSQESQISHTDTDSTNLTLLKQSQESQTSDTISEPFDLTLQTQSQESQESQILQPAQTADSYSDLTQQTPSQKLQKSQAIDPSTHFPLSSPLLPPTPLSLTYNMSMDKVTHLLQQHFHIADWSITPPEDGQQKACVVAQSGKLKVFIKFAVPIAPLLRLGQIGVAPPVLASGTVDGISYVVQEYMTGSYPDWHWFSTHLANLAAFIHRYHADVQLTALLVREVSTNYAEHIALDIADLEAQVLSLASPVLQTPDITTAFAALKAQSKHLQPVALVPIHADPNTKNILLVADQMFMVDWDDIRLSDPMQDIGLLLWWYVAREQWQDFFQNFGLPMDQQLTARIFWWAARSSFAIALWHIDHQYDPSSFLKDFIAAVHKESNPHAVFR